MFHLYVHSIITILTYLFVKYIKYTYMILKAEHKFHSLKSCDLFDVWIKGKSRKCGISEFLGEWVTGAGSYWKKWQLQIKKSNIHQKY